MREIVNCAKSNEATNTVKRTVCVVVPPGTEKLDTMTNSTVTIILNTYQVLINKSPTKNSRAIHKYYHFLSKPASLFTCTSPFRFVTQLVQKMNTSILSDCVRFCNIFAPLGITHDAKFPRKFCRWLAFFKFA